MREYNADGTVVGFFIFLRLFDKIASKIIRVKNNELEKIVFTVSKPVKFENFLISTLIALPLLIGIEPNLM